MSTLTGNKISLTYKSLIKTADNDVLTAVLKELSDGLGNNSGVFLNTGGDLKSTGILEFANFKGTSTSVTINKLVNEADGISNNDNDTSLATSAAVKDYVDTHVTTQDLDFSDGTNPGAVDLDSQVFAIVGTSNEIETAASNQQLQIGLPNDVTIGGTYTGTTFLGDLSGTINTATTATTQTAGDNSTKVATTAYVDTLDAASDLDFSDGTTNSAVNLNTQVFSVEGTSNEITTTASGQSLTVSLDSTGVNLPDNSTAITQTAGDNSTKVATTAYVDVLDSASDLDIAGDTGTGDVNLNTQTFTLSGTTNQVITSVSGQEATFSLPSTVHRNLQGNVTGDLTGNADTATAWETARDLILSSEATGTISNVDGTQNVTGAVTLLNSAVTGKVLTGLPTPAAGNIQSSDTILEAFGKLQSQVSSISNGLIFKGSWDAATNTPTLTSGGGEVDSGTTTGQTAFKLIETGQNFNTTVTIGDKVINQVDGTTALVTVIDSNTQLTLDADIMLSGEAYTIDASPFIPQGNYYVVNYAGTTNLNGITDWSIGDWVIADADNRWSKLDHSQVDGQGTPGHLPVFATATTIGDSIVAQSGTALTVTGSLSTTLGASVTGDFAVNTDKFTVAAASGNTAFTGDLAINTNKFTVNATSGNTVVGGTGTFGGAVRINATTTTGLVISSSSGASNGLKLYNNSTTDNAYIYNHFDGNLEIGTNNATVLTMNGTSSTFAGNVTINKASNPTSLQIGSSLADDPFIVFQTDGNTMSMGIDRSDSNKFVISDNATLGTNNRLTIDTSGNSTFTGNVGIGGTLANKKLYVLGDTTNYQILAEQPSGYAGLSIKSTTVAQTWSWLANDNGSNSDLLLYGGAAAGTKLTIDSSGNVGIGVTPSTTQTITTQITNGISLFGNNLTPYGFISNNHVWATGTGDTYLVSGYGASYYKQYQGVHSWATAPSGTAGGALTFTERMRITSDGNVSIGTVNRVSRLTIGGIGSTANFNDGANNLRLETSSTPAASPDVAGAGITFAQKYWSGSATLARVGAIYGVKDASNGNYGGGLGFYTQPSGVTTDMVQRMRIDSSGNVGIGTDDPNQEDFGTSNRVLSVKAPTSGGAGSIELIGLGNTDGDEIGYVNFMSQSATNSLASIVGLRRSDDETGKLAFRTAGTTKFTIEDDNQIRYVGDFYFSTNTSNGSDDGSLNFSGGGGFGSTRGASIGLAGNEDGNGGLMQLIAGNGSISQIRSYTSGVERMRLQANGRLTLGDNLTLSAANNLTLTNASSAEIDINCTGGHNYRIASDTSDDFIITDKTVALERMRISSSGLATFKNNIELDSTTPTLSLEGRNSGNSGAVIQFLGWNGVYKNWRITTATAGAGTLNFRVSSSGGGDSGWATVGTIDESTGAYTASSDINRKKDLEDSEIGLKEVMELQPKLYRMKEDDKDSNKHLGFIAQEVEKVLPQAYLEQGEDDDKFIGLTEMPIIAALTKGIQELKAEVDKLKQECKCK